MKEGLVTDGKTVYFGEHQNSRMMLMDIFWTRFLTDVVHLNHPETSQRRFAPTPDHFTGIRTRASGIPIFKVFAALNSRILRPINSGSDSDRPSDLTGLLW